MDDNGGVIEQRPLPFPALVRAVCPSCGGTGQPNALEAAAGYGQCVGCGGCGWQWVVGDA